MTYTTRSAAEAVKFANAQTRWPRLEPRAGQCLNFVKTCLTDISAGPVAGYDANSAWTAAEQKEYEGTSPPGAPVYFKGGKHGHIVLSLGNGKVRSTDYQTDYGYRAGYVGTATINEIAVEFFGTTSAYRGWSRDYCGQIIRGLEETSTNYSPPPITAPKGFLMALSDSEQELLFNRVKLIYDRVLGGIPDGKASGRNNPDGSNARVLDTADGDYLRRMLVGKLDRIIKKLGA